MASAFAATGALQCGFCTPGILVRVASLLDRKGSDLDRDTAARHLGAHLCRCTGLREDPRRGRPARAASRELEPLGGVGTSGTRYEGFDLALGEKPYVDDLRLDGAVARRAASRRSRRADVVRIDTTAARRCRASCASSPRPTSRAGCRVGLIHKDWPVFIPEGGRTSYLGDVLAFVVAADRDDPARGRARRRRIRSVAPVDGHGRPRSPTTTTRSGSSTATCCRVPRTHTATPTRRSQQARTSCTRSSRPNASSARSSNPNRRSSCPRRTAA